MSAQVVLLSGDVHSGKTTLLSAWIAHRAGRVGGVLAPDVDDVRYVKSIRTSESRQLQLPQFSPAAPDDCNAPSPSAPDNAPPDVVFIGKYAFSRQVFNWAQDTIASDFFSGDFDAVVVDEIGPLEVNRAQGLEPGFGDLIARRSERPDVKIVVVVRQKLVAAFKAKYQLRDEDVADFRVVYE
eukprot:TRINITY_DN22667_c0_g1_i1.p2 TRINITY_DN22667_c0_g1~~TRINITY_DN22667_c0_g1_i1.p2  ORF type:complete len:183 (-),score=62.57 TRINITY_DN22667_c0_g1_i1:207-755(-)